MCFAAGKSSASTPNTSGALAWALPTGLALCSCLVACQSDAESGLEIDRRLVTAVHVERHREVLVRGLPPAVLLGEPNGGTHPDVGLLAVRPLSGDAVEAGGERHLVAYRDA